MLILWFRVYYPDGAIIQYKYLNRPYFDCKTKLCLGRQRKIYFYTKSFYLQGVLNDINNADTSFLDCKHKHMMKNGAPPNKIRGNRLLPIEFHRISQAELVSNVYHSLVLGLISVC